MKTLNVSDETYELIKVQLKNSEISDVSEINDMIGKSFFFRTVTYHIVGCVEKVISGHILKLSNASWIADSGRFMQAIEKGTLDEVEPLGIWFVNLDATTDFGPWIHNLPKEQQ